MSEVVEWGTDEAEEIEKSGGDYFKVPDGLEHAAEFIPFGKVHVEHVVFIEHNGERTRYKFDEAIHPKKEKRTRYKVAVYAPNVTEDGLVEFEFGKTVFKGINMQFKKRVKEKGELLRLDVHKTGSGLKTEYHVDFVDKVDKKLIKKLKSFDPVEFSEASADPAADDFDF